MKPTKCLVVFDKLLFRTLSVDQDTATLEALHPAIESIVIDKKNIVEVWELVGYYQKDRKM